MWYYYYYLQIAGLRKREAGGELVTGLASLRSSPDRPALTPLGGVSRGGFPPELAGEAILQPVRLQVTMAVITNMQGALCMGCPWLSAYCLFLLPK